MAVPIWKDNYINLGSSNVYYYRVRLTDSSGEIIYSGKAYKRPDADNVLIKINDVCADYLEQSLPTLSNGGFTEQAVEQVFYVEKSTTGTSYSSAGSITFNMDWSYDYNFNAAVNGLSHPITGEVAKNQFLLFTTPTANYINVTYRFADNHTMTQRIEISRGADFNGGEPDGDFTEDFALTARGAMSGTAVINLAQTDGVRQVTFGNRVYNVLPDCYDYALYYINAYGGWDSLLIKGLTKTTDNYTRHSHKLEYDNRDIQNRGTRNYANEVSRAYEIKTGWMSDDAASRMHHLLGSTNVYLYDFVEGHMIPVTLEDTACEYKTYHSEGNRLVNYIINAVEAHEMVRK